MRQRIIAFIRSPHLVYLGSSVIGRLGSIFLIPLYTRALSREEFATVSLAGTVQSLLMLLLSLGLTAGISKVYFDTPKGEAPEGPVGVIARGVVGLVASFSLVLSLAIWALWPAGGVAGFTQHQALLVVVAGAGSALTAIPDVWYRAKRMAMWSATVNLLLFGLNVGLALLYVVKLGRGLDGVLEATATAAAVMGAWGLVFTFVILRRGSSTAVQAGGLGRAIRFSMPFVPHHLASWVFSVGDRWALVSMGQLETLGLYSLGQQLASPLSMVSTSINEVEVAVMGQAFRERGVAELGPQLTRGLRRYLGLTGLAYGGLLLLLPILQFVLGPKFQAGLWLVPFVGLAGIIDSAYLPPVNVLYYAARTKWIPMITITAAVFSIAAAAGLAALFGLVGLIVARILSALARVGLCVLLAKRAIREEAPNSPEISSG